MHSLALCISFTVLKLGFPNDDHCFRWSVRSPHSVQISLFQTWKSVEAVDKSLVDMINVKNYDMTEVFSAESPVVKPAVTPEMRKKRFETEEYYFEVSESSSGIPVIAISMSCHLKSLLFGEFWFVKNYSAPRNHKTFSMCE